MKRALQLQAAAQQYGVNRAGAEEAIYQPLYHYQTYPAAGSTLLTFFQTAVGAAPNQIADTNMEQGGFLAAPQKYLLKGIEVHFRSGVEVGNSGLVATTGLYADDVNAVMLGAAILRLRIGSKDYVVDGPLAVFPPTWGLTGFTAMTGVGSAAGSLDQVVYARTCGKPYEPLPFFIPPVQNFRVTLEFPTVIATPSTVAGRIGVRLLGDLYRLSQ